MKKQILTILLLLAASGCQTRYQEGDLTGGVKALPVTANTYRISANGNGYTTNSIIQDYVLLKAAETTISSKNTHFLVMERQDTTERTHGQTGSTGSFIGNTLTISPGMPYTIVRPGSDTMIKVLKVAEGEAGPKGAYDAKEVYSYINPRVLRPKKQHPSSTRQKTRKIQNGNDQVSISYHCCLGPFRKPARLAPHS